MTGAAGDIGSAICRRLRNDGYIVAGIDKRDCALQELERDVDCLGLCADVTDLEQLRDAIHRVKRELGQIGVVVNCAGGPCTNTIRGTSVADWRYDVELNLNAPFYVLAETLPDMERMEHGIIINICSVNALSTYGHPAYSAAKAGLINLTKFVATEYGRKGIRCNAICPGTVQTRAWADRRSANPEVFDQLRKLYSLDRVCEPDDVAAFASFLASPEAKMITGGILLMDGGLTAGVPTLAAAFTQTEFC